MKNSGQEAAGVSPLKNKDGVIKTGSTNKPTFSMNSLCPFPRKKTPASSQTKTPSPYPSMPNIEVNWKGVHKLFKGLKTSKATGPDSFPVFILKAASDELAPMLTRIYQTSLDIGRPI